MARTRTTVRRIIVVSLLALGLAAQAAPANAEPKTTTESVPTMVILDASGSMLNEDAPGKRIDAAKQAIHGMVDQLPGDARLGLQVYGTGTGSNDSEKQAGCQDIKTLVPVGPVDKGTFLSAVDAVNASGYTPIGNALREAVKALPAEGPRAIVLVSDGIDTCAPPPPCDVAKELAAQDGLNLTVHTVGFLVDEQARADLQCIAEATGGTYADANNADQLDQAIQQKVEYAISGYEVEGIPVIGTATADDPAIPLLTPGQYTDTVPALPDENSELRRHYKINPPEGWTPRVAVTGVYPVGSGGYVFYYGVLDIKAYDSEQTLCGNSRGISGELGNDRKPVVASMKVSCEGETIITVTREGKLHAADEMPIELVVRFEPPADASGVPAAEIRPVPEPPARSTEVLPLTGGSSFNNAVEITGGQTYSSTIHDEEVLYFKIPVSWGQQLTYQFTPGARDGDPEESLTTAVNIYDPMRNLQYSASENDLWYGEGGPESLPVTGGTDEPVRYTSRNYPLDGYYYVMMTLDGYATSGASWQNFEFTVDTAGQIESGPVYLTSSESPSATPSSTPSSTTTPTGEPDDLKSAGSSTAPLWIMGGVVVVGAAAGILVIQRRRG